MTHEVEPVIEVDDDELLGQADWVIGGEAAAKARRQGLYAAYILFLGALVYGFPFVQAVFRTSDTAWLSDQLTSVGAFAVLAASLAVVLGAAAYAGRFRGPVVPPLPWIDLVVTAPIDRALSVRRWWRFAVVAGLFLGGLVGLVLGSGLAFARVTGLVSIAVSTATGVAVGALATRVWLWAQVRSWPGPERGPSLLWRVTVALRELHVESLRAHSANTSTLAGSAVTGNLRTARLALARPVRHARSARLRPGRPFPVLVRRDVLGLRRAPASVVAGLGFVGLGSALVVWGVTQPAAPGIAVTAGLVPLYLGFGAWAEGLRLQADNVGTPSLLGVGPQLEAGAHLVVPTALTAGVLAVGLGMAALVVPIMAPGVLSLAVIVALLVGGHLLAAFRGSPRFITPQSIIAWYLLPSTTVVVLGSLLPFSVKAGLTSTWLAIPGWLTVVVVVLGFARVKSLTHLHRS